MTREPELSGEKLRDQPAPQSESDAKPQRELWELNNRYREFWGQPLCPKPEGGFALPDRPPKFDEVLGWFREATTNQPHRRRQPAVPDDKEIARIARLVDELAQLPLVPPSELAMVDKLARAVDRLEAALLPVLDRLVPGMMPGDPAVCRLIDLHNTLFLAKPYIPPPPKQGPPHPAWHRITNVLEPRIREALASAGRRKVSAKPDGPLVRIIRLALKAIDGGDYEPTAIASALERAPKRGAK